MKRLVLIAAMLALGACLSFAEDANSARGDYTVRTEGLESVTGVVRSVQPAGLTRPNSVIVVTDESGKDLAITLRPSVVVYRGEDGKMVSVKELAELQRVQVSYAMSDGRTPKAEAVKILPLLSKEESKPADNAVKPEEAIK
jgi:hypothetical protein